MIMIYDIYTFRSLMKMVMIYRWLTNCPTLICILDFYSSQYKKQMKKIQCQGRTFMGEGNFNEEGDDDVDSVL